jgi:hypothetical protein
MKWKCIICGKTPAKGWLYAPATDGFDDFYCDNCVPRGCSCNEELNEGIAFDSKEAEDPQNYHHKLDERGRKYPCVEYWFVDNEFEKEQRIPIDCLRGDRGD